MTKFKVSEISDGLFILISSFILSFFLSLYFIKKGTLALVCSIATSVILFCLYSLYQRKKKGKLLIKREDEELYLKTLNALCLMKSQEAYDVIFNTILNDGKKPLRTPRGIILEDKFIVVKFCYDGITANDVVEAFKTSPKSKILVFIGVEFSQSATTFSENFKDKISLVSLNQIFPIMKKNKTLPEGGFIPKKTKTRISTLFLSTFDKKRAKTFTIYGVALLIMSNFVFFPVWYIISGSIFLIYAIIIKFFAKKPTYKSIFD